VTFLFTDIEGSTRLLNELGDRYPEALGHHRRLLREAFARHDGAEVDTQGDAFFVAFADARGAVTAAAEAQAALAGGPIRVRMGLHTGEPIVWEEGYAGLDVHRGARICAAAHGGQIVLSERTRAEADGVFVRDLGMHRLKDLWSRSASISLATVTSHRCERCTRRTFLRRRRRSSAASASSRSRPRSSANTGSSH